MGEADEALEQLKQCTVCLNKSSGDRGTGFFVAVGQVLTCAHVLKGKTSNSVWWQGEKYETIAIGIEENPIDLALLQLVGNVPQHPIVALDAAASIDDSLYSFGYTDQYIEGDPADFKYVDLTGGDWPLMKFKEGQVRPGLSGSPLLNRRTGKVCGVVKKTRDRASDLGGRGIPMQTVFQVFPQLQPATATFATNPFLQRGTIDCLELIYGREADCQQVMEFLAAGSSVALIGPSGIGKSSLLAAIRHQAKKLPEPRQPIYLNMSNLFGEADFYAALCEEIGIPQCTGYKFSQLLKPKRILLLLDEVERMTQDWFSRPVRQQFRGLANAGNSSPLRLVVTARTSLDRLFRDSGQDSPFQEICQELELKFWNRETIQSFIASRLAGTSVRFTEKEIQEIAIRSEGIPSQVMQRCYECYERYRD